MSGTLLDPENLEVLVYNRYEFSWWQIIWATALLAGLMLLCWIVEGGQEVGFLWGAVAIALLLPLAGTVIRIVQCSSPPLAIDRNRIMVSTVWGNGAYIPWTEVQCVAFVHFVSGRPPLQPGMLIYRRGMLTTRANLSQLSADEFVALAEIVQRISGLQDFEVVTGFTDAGQRRLRELPWA